MILLSAEQGLKAEAIAKIVCESHVTVLHWLKRYLAAGIDGLADAPRPGRSVIVTDEYRQRLLETVRRHPRSLGLEYRCGPYNDWPIISRRNWDPGLPRNRAPRVSQARYRFQSSAAYHFQSGPGIPGKKKASEEIRDHLKAGEVFYYADEFKVSWLPTLHKLWSPKGQQVKIPTPGQPKTHYGLGAVNYHTGENVVLIRRRKRRQEVAELLQALLDKHPTETIYVAWDNAITHQDDEVEAVVRAAAGRLVLLYLPTYSPWLNPIEMLWRHFRREVTHCELFETVKVLIEAAYAFFCRYNQCPGKTLMLIGADVA
jgi:putative transposase